MNVFKKFRNGKLVEHTIDGQAQTIGPGIGLGDIAEKVFKPAAKILRLDCLDAENNLKPESVCGKRKKKWNKIRIR